MNLKNAAVHLKHRASTTTDRGDTLKVWRLNETLCGNTPMILRLNVALTTAAAQQPGLAQRHRPRNVKVQDGDALCSDFDLPGRSQ
ncbi:hypothetical protein ACQ4N7_09535 [Nodosilinea sp. AN01ver1]|uniref:hypothetical protein n=1 Tax=Nodosilinea sp. AN01ver1 TaxID=3423362 RepID=UPI003D31DBFA